MFISKAKTVARQIELARRITHACGGFPFLLYAIDVISWSVLGGILWVGIGLVFVLEYLRLFRGVTHAIYRRLTRPYEATSVAAYAYYAVGLGVAWLLYTPELAILGAVALAIGDPLSGALSSPGDSLYRRSVSGIAVAATAGIAALVLFGSTYSTAVLGLVAVIAGAAAVISDMYTFRLRGKAIDDNLLLPLVPPAVVLLLTSVIPLL